jgi:hypothetical protein
LTEPESVTPKLNPRRLLKYLASFPKGTYGKTTEEIDSYIRREREGWSRRARIAEGDPDLSDRGEDSAS